MPETEIKTIARNAVYSIVIALIMRGFLFFVGYHTVTVLDEIKLDLIIIGFSSILVLLILLMRIRAPIFVMMKIDTLINRKIRKQFYKFIESNLNDLYDMLVNTQSERGATLNVNSVKELVNILFELSEGRYDGTAINVPSEYYALYPNYLEAHERNIISKGNSPGTRVLIVERNSLAQDFADNTKECHDFTSWHIRNRVTLNVMDSSTAKALSEKYKLPDNITDVGIWHDRYALLFKPLGNGEIRLYMRFQGDKDYKNILEYFEELDKKSPEIDIFSLFENGKKTKLPEKLFSARLAREWMDFVNCEKRMEKEGPLFLDVLMNKYKKTGNSFVIFDAAVGTGCESIYFVKKGIRVISNEVNPTFQIIANKNAKNEGLNLEITSWDWRELDMEFKERYGDLKVNMVLLLGNSFCHLLNKKDILRSLINIKSILSPGGALVIDERNFDYILKNEDEILKDPIRNFRYRGDVIYCGETVKGVPTSIDKDRNVVVFSYYQVPQSDQGEINSEKNIKDNFIDDLQMYPFKYDELKNLLERAGFVNIDRYSDFKHEYNKDSDFFIYVAEVPLST